MLLPELKYNHLNVVNHNKIMVVYIWDSMSYVKYFKDHLSCRKWINKFPEDKRNGYWIEFVGKGYFLDKDIKTKKAK